MKSITHTTTAGAGFPGSVTFRTGVDALGFLNCEVPDGSRIGRRPVHDEQRPVRRHR
jgi:hypothetical protein